MSFDRAEHAQNLLYDNNQNLTSSYLRNMQQDQSEKEIEFTAYYEHNFAQEDHTLRFEFTSARAPETEDNRYTDIYSLPDLPDSYDKSLIKSKENSTEFSLEYSNPLTEESGSQVRLFGGTSDR